MLVQYVGAHDVVHVPAIAADVRRFEVIGVPDDVAGAAAFWRDFDPVTDAQAWQWMECELGSDQRPVRVRDLGSGLLAQPDSWVPAPPVKAKKSATENEQVNS